MAEDPSITLDAESAGDPLRERIMREVRFRDDDPPEVREAIIDEAVRRDQSFHRDALHAPPSDKR